MAAPPLIVEDGSGLTNSNSFESAADATTYFTSRALGDAWGNLDADTQTLYLVDACRLMVQEIRVRRWRWRGWPLAITQSLPLPRAGLVNPNGLVLDIHTIPQDVKDVQSEIAFLFVAGDPRLIAQQPREQSVRLGQTSVTYARVDGMMPLIPEFLFDPMLWTLDTARRAFRG